MEEQSVMASTTNSAELDDADQGSESLQEYICKPCNNRGKVLEADGMCLDCQEHLCQRCFDCHTVPSVTQHHVLLDKQQMLKSEIAVSKEGIKSETVAKKDTCTEICEEHEDKVIQYYCLDHCSLGCQVCMTVLHKLCPPAIYIPKIAKNIEKSKAFKEFEAQMKVIEEESKRVSRVAKQNKNLIKSCEVRAVAKFKDYKTEMLEAFAKAEEQLKKDIDQVKSKENKKVKTLADLGLNTMAEIKAMSSQMQSLQESKQYCNMYIAMVRQRGTLQELESKLGKQIGNIRLFQFEVDKGASEILSGRKTLGKLQAGTIKKFDLAGTIDVKSAKDESSCQVTGIAVLPPYSIIISDLKNQKLKLINARENQVVSELLMSSRPYYITSVDNSEAAVTLPSERKIAFVKKTNAGLRVERELSLTDSCDGVDYREGLLAVSYAGPGKIEIMDVYGNIRHRIETGAIVRENVLISSDKSFLYLSDWQNNAVVIVRLNGTVIATYTDKNLKYPLQSVVDSQGMVYICGKDSNNVHQVSKAGKKAKEIVKASDGLNKPTSIAYSQTEDRFYIGQEDSDEIKVFSITLG